MKSEAIDLIGEEVVFCGNSRIPKEPVESAFDTKIVVRRRVVYTRSSIAKTRMGWLAPGVFAITDAVKKWVSQNVRSGFLFDGGANSGSHFVGGVETW